MALRQDRIAINPLQWFASKDGWLDPSLAPPLPERLATIRRAGIAGVHTDVPPDSTTAAYAALLAGHGLTPAPGYLNCPLDETPEDRRNLREQAHILAEQHAELGVPSLFIAMGMTPDAVRITRPAIGHDRSADRLERVRDLLADISGVVRSHGITPGLHQHVGTWVETEEETRFILDTIDARLLAFGPDMGHLGWAGADPAQLVRDYADRVVGVHVKDYLGEVADQGKREGWDYRTTVQAGLWKEPGHGTNNISAVLDALPDAYDGWLVIEVDCGSTETPEESVQMCGDWVRSVTRPSSP